jgi:CRISPR-associated protein Csb1
MSELLNLETVRSAVQGTAAAFRRVTELQPAGGVGDKVFPPTYEGGRYATEMRWLDGREVPCVLLDSVQSQANRMELALLEAHRAGRVRLPLLITRFDQDGLLKRFEVSSLEAPHRVADALLRDSLLDGVIFRRSERGRLLDTADARHATGLFGLCPTALLFGLWDSTGPRGGMGAKFQRALVSEIVGYDAVLGVKTSSRIDPAEIQRSAALLYERKAEALDAPAWTLDSAQGGKKLGKDGKPSEANHGNVTPSCTDGGFTISRAMQTTVISLPALRRLRFPLSDAPTSEPAVDLAARAALVALGLAAATLAGQDGDLRSRCQLVPQQAPVWELLDRPGQAPARFALHPDDAIDLLNAAIEAAHAAGLPWEGEIVLTPAPELVELVRRSQELAANTGTETA